MANNSARDWSNWFWTGYFDGWRGRVTDGDAGVFDLLDHDGMPDLTAGKSLLAQARMLFTLSHVALLSGDPAYANAAHGQAEFMTHFRKDNGLYRNAVQRDGTVSGKPADEASRSYDMTFVILGLVTWNKVSPDDQTVALIEDCWSALQSHLSDPATGLLLNDDAGAINNPAQNPHMHLYEACLQAYQMTDNKIWLTRAAALRSVGVRYFMDQTSGSIAEFLTPELQPLPGADGQRREIGHQCEWAWLLAEEARLSGQSDLLDLSNRLYDFARSFGFAQSGPLKGAAYDAVSATGETVENSFLLWPQTEAIKILAVRHTLGDPGAGEHARALLSVMFESWFKDRPVYINQLDADGETLWPQALTRLMYHVVLAMTESARAGLLPDIPRHGPR